MPFATLLPAEIAEWYKAYHVCHHSGISTRLCNTLLDSFKEARAPPEAQVVSEIAFLIPY